MNKSMRELLASIQTKNAEVKTLLESGNTEQAESLLKEIENLTAKYELEKRLFETEKFASANTVAPLEPSVEPAAKTVEPSETEKFVKAVKTFIKKGLVEGVDADGGYTVPEDVSTKIEHYNEVSYDLTADIDVVTVKTNKGSRTFQKKSAVDVFADIDENGEINNEITAPQFERLPYVIKDRAGFMPVSNDLVNDSDANIVNIVTEWLGKARVATTNAKVIAEIKKKPQVAFAGLNDIKKALNVTLGQAYKNGAVLYTNDDGLNYLDTLEDANGRPLLNPDPTAPAKLTLRCGVTMVPVKVIPNTVLPTVESKIPMIVGNLKDYVRKYDRQHMTIKASDVASIGSFNAFANNMTVFRAILRDDYRVKDADSIVNGYILGE